MKNPTIILFVSLAWFGINSCQKSDSNNNTPPPAPKVSITQTPLTILLPNNCPQSFTITNTGPQGSTLNYTIKDDGALQGFLEYGYGSGTNTLAAGASNTIPVVIKPAFASDASLVGASLVLNVYTPNASNFTKIPVSVNIKSINTITQSLIGTWKGTWWGTVGPSIPAEPSEPVSGTWSMNIISTDTAKNTIMGSFTWQGTDAYWAFVYDNGGNVVSATLTSVPVNETIQLNASNTTYFLGGGNSVGGCDQNDVSLTITSNTAGDFVDFHGDFDVTIGKIQGGTDSFNSSPYPIFLSGGTVGGAKQ